MTAGRIGERRRLRERQGLMMKTPLVFMNLRHQPMRTFVAILGVGFAVLLIFMQLGFYGSAEAAATSLYDALDFDLILISTNYLNSTNPRSFPLHRLYQAQAHGDVETVAPLYVGWQTWRIRDARAYRRVILVLAFDLNQTVFHSDVFESEPMETCRDRLHTPDTVLMDTGTRKYFGPRGVGVKTKLNEKTIEVVGQFTINTGYGADGMVMTADRTYFRLTSPDAQATPSLGLIRLRDSARGRAEEVKRELRQTVFAAQPSDEVHVLTRAEMRDQERRYWTRRTPVGVIFQMGVAVALLVGIIFVYQVIATDISDHFAEYATLRAIGYSSLYLSGIVLRQAVVLAVLGYIPAFFAALGLYALGRNQAELLLFMTEQRAIYVLILTFAMCSVSGLLAVQKVKAADPADLF
jgi:putative ABC transport system permease protein